MDIMRTSFRVAAAMVGFLFLAAVPGSAVAAPLVVSDLRCEHLREPRGIDTERPRLSWVLESSRQARGKRQSAYQILVASTRKNLDQLCGDLWDSGKVRSSQSVLVPYSGKDLTSGQECFWKVRAWDEEDAVSGWSPVAAWTMGLLDPADWQGQWIGRDEQIEGQAFTGASWIWFPEGRGDQSAPVGTRYFRRSFDLADGREIESAKWLYTGDNIFEVWINGVKVGRGGSFNSVQEVDVAAHLRPGNNVLAASVQNLGEGPNPAGLLALLVVKFADGKELSVPTDAIWSSTVEEFAGWETPGYDSSTWLTARVLGAAGIQPWGEVAMPEDRRVAARWVRKEFAVERKLRRATVYMAGVGLSELYVNGRRIGDAVLSPGLTEYDKRVFYVTHDITRELASGRNALGVVLGNGRFWAPRGKVPTETQSYGYPKLRLQLNLEYADGSSGCVVSDGSWKLTSAGPILANCEYDGEEFDARMVMEGWNRAGYDDEAWENASVVKGPNGVLKAEMINPIRVTQTLRPVKRTRVSPGVYIFDMGQNMVGWCRLKVSGPADTRVQLRHAETLKADGTLYLDNIRSARVTDSYVLSGKGREVYEPRFTYHGFRYVEVTGYPGTPPLSALEGRVVHDDLAPAGEFACSNPLLNAIASNITWGVRGNYRSIPTDCPQRDERQGWLGDRSAESKGESYLYDIAALYRKWLRDMADAQKPSGSVPDVCPSYWPIYSDNVTWPSSTVIIPGTLLEQYGDAGILAEHYESARKWLTYMRGFVTNGIIERDSYGDWCVPPEDPKLIHSNDPNRRTDKALLATAYLYHDATLMARYARLLGKGEDEAEFRRWAAELKEAFNAKFFRPEQGYYDNGSQTACVLPLAFGLAPENARARVFARLVDKIEKESKFHIGTGLVGGQWLMRVLSDHGRADLGYRIATQKTYPSWGYMLEQGATTIWELWNGNTADPAMNSHNHVMLVGDLGIWMYEYLGGIRSDPERPGFRHIILKPEMVPGLDFAKATHRSPYGVIGSQWENSKRRFRWDLTIPVNCEATVYVPARDVAQVREGFGPATKARGMTFLRMEGERAVFRVQSGRYRLTSRLD